MINVKPGYWDVDRCSWVGLDPMNVTPPLRHAEHPHDRDVAVPEPRTAFGEETVEQDPAPA
jgi:hypothetical protein